MDANEMFDQALEEIAAEEEANKVNTEEIKPQMVDNLQFTFATGEQFVIPMEEYYEHLSFTNGTYDYTKSQLNYNSFVEDVTNLRYQMTCCLMKNEDEIFKLSENYADDFLKKSGVNVDYSTFEETYSDNKKLITIVKIVNAIIFCDACINKIKDINLRENPNNNVSELSEDYINKVNKIMESMLSEDEIDFLNSWGDRDLSDMTDEEKIKYNDIVSKLSLCDYEEAVRKLLEDVEEETEEEEEEKELVDIIETCFYVEFEKWKDMISFTKIYPEECKPDWVNVIDSIDEWRYNTYVFAVDAAAAMAIVHELLKEE